LKEKDEAHRIKRGREDRREIKEKEERIMVIKDHQNDVKEFNTDTKSF
jgi:hypothetical protein